MTVATRLIAAFLWLTVGAGMAAAQDRPDGLVEWQIDFQKPATLVMEYIHWFGWYTLIIVTAIVIFVMLLLAWCIVAYGERKNPVPSRVTHNTSIEVAWTVIPVLILVLFGQRMIIAGLSRGAIKG